MDTRLFAVLVALLSCSVFAAKDDSGKDPCFAGDTVRLTGSETNSTCSTVVGRVEVCEEGEWRNLCDSNWTVQDAAVTCRSLGYSGQNAENMKDTGQIASGSSLYALKCNGSETNITDCDSVMENDDPNQRCSAAFLVLCYLTDEAAERLCEAPVSELATTPSPPSLSTTGGGDTGMPITMGPTNSPTPSRPATPTGTRETTTQTTLLQASQSADLLAGSNLYYLVGALSVVIVAVSMMIVVCLCACFCCRKRRKDVSPLGQQEKGREELHRVDITPESQDGKDHNAAQYRLQQQPIYEAIVNESSSTHSQESPSMKPLRAVPTAVATPTSDLYASLDNNNTYAELEPHISSPLSANTISSPNADMCYQQLNHRTGSRTGSMKRELPSRPVQAMNPTALAMERGEVGERDLSAQGEVFVQGSSTSLPTNTGHSFQPRPNGSVQQPHLEQVHLKEVLEKGGAASGEQPNIYSILDPPPDYSTLEQIDEVSQVSTTAVCNNGVARGRSGSRSKEHSPQTSRHSQERFPEHLRSSTLPSSSHSPRSSRTSSVSSHSSQHMNRSPPTVRTTNHHKVGNKYSDDPTGSHRIMPHSGQLNGTTDAIDTMV